jgi:AcrR family transcriptional regulator
LWERGLSVKLEAGSGTKWSKPPDKNYSGGPLRFVKRNFVWDAEMGVNTTETLEEALPRKPKRADALRNYEKVVAAAREAFAERGEDTSLEEIARRAEVGIGTLYRNFPNRQSLLEAVYVGEVEDLCRSSAELEGLEPWEAFAAWVRRLVGYLATKQALAHELLEYLDRDAPLFKSCRASLLTAGQPVLDRAQEAGVVRADTDLWDIIQMVGGIAKIPGAEPAQIEHLVGIALDGLRFRAAQ